MAAAKPLAALIAATLLGVVPAAEVSGGDDDLRGLREPTAEGMAADALVVRPVGIAATIVGAVIYAISLPFSYAGGNQQQAYETLVVDPATHTFQRPLGEGL